MQFREMYERAMQFILRDLWSLELAGRGRWSRIGVRWLRTLSLAMHGFRADKCALRAAALTLVFLFSLAPTLAVGFSVAKGFGAQQMIKEKVPEWFRALAQGEDGNSDFAGIEKILVDTLDYVDRTNVGALGVVGVLIALYAAFKLLSAVEKTMNEIWGVRRQRNPVRKVVDYAAVMFVFPLILMCTIFLMASLRMEQLAGFLGHPIATKILGGVIALALVSLAFWFLYAFFPNTRVPALSGLAGGIAAALLLGILQWIVIRAQVGVSRASAVYGTFAALPIFILWMHFSWLVVLFGAELSYAHANKKDLLFGGISFAPSAAYEEQLALGVMTVSAQAFSADREARTCEGMANELGAPVRVTRHIIGLLMRAGLLSELQGDVPAFQPALPVSHITFRRVVDAVRNAGDSSKQTCEVLDRLGVSVAIRQRDQLSAAVADMPLLELTAPGVEAGDEKPEMRGESCG